MRSRDTGLTGAGCNKTEKTNPVQRDPGEETGGGGFLEDFEAEESQVRGE